MVKKATTKKVSKKITFRVSPITNGYLVAVWRESEWDEQQETFCATREEVVQMINKLVF